jgi:ABC-type transporter Mla subunit MlaD
MPSPWLTVRYYVVIATIVTLGLLSTGYVLAHEGGGLPDPWGNVYEINAAFSAADGVVPGIGQPVDVAGVDVGSIVGTRLDKAGNAVVTLEIKHGDLPHVYANASAVLQPITPLDNMIAPGGPPAPALRNGATLTVGQTSPPTQLSDILAAFDGDTRDYLTSLITSMGEGTAAQGGNLRRALLALGPTTRQLHQIGSALAARRVALSQLVHNLAVVTRAGTRDRQLAAVVQAGDETLHAVATESVSLRQGIAQLPATMRSVKATLGYASTFAQHLRPAVAVLLPPLKRLPATLHALGPFAQNAASVITEDVLPLVIRAQPVVGSLGIATPKLTALTPQMTSVFQVLNYTLNVLAYNPNHIANGGLDEGGLFWLSWMVHNLNSAFSLGDANGALGRAMFVDSCGNEVGLLDNEVRALIGATLPLESLCPH